MIKARCISDVDIKEFDEVWWIVRSPKEIPKEVKWVCELSPSVKLFEKYRKAYHAGLFDERFFNEIYVSQFLEELSENKEALALLDKLYKEGEEKNIALCCYCEDESLCHRSIIAGILLGLGAKIETKYEYIEYFRKIKNLK